jgi:hypothetical protein
MNSTQLAAIENRWQEHKAAKQYYGSPEIKGPFSAHAFHSIHRRGIIRITEAILLIQWNWVSNCSHFALHG